MPSRPPEGAIQIPSSAKDLEIWVKDCGAVRSVFISGPHVLPGGEYRCPQSELETRLSLETLRRIAAVQGRHFRDEIERSENPGYMQRGLANLIREFGITLEEKSILDFGCGAGAFSLNLLRLGATRITGVEVNRGLIAAAESRLGDFFPGRFALRRIEYIDGEYRLPFVDGQFDIVWAHAVMEHVLPRQRRFVLGELWRVLKRGGIFVVDGTPNKLWIIEFHTSGLPFLNYLPLRIAAGLARRFSERIPPDQTNERLLERGFRGCTYWEILHSLPGAETVNLRNPRSDIRLWRAAWWKKKDTWKRNPWKRLYGGLLYLASPILSMLRIPPVALLPGLILVMRKPEGE